VNKYTRIPYCLAEVVVYNTLLLLHLKLLHCTHMYQKHMMHTAQLYCIFIKTSTQLIAKTAHTIDFSQKQLILANVAHWSPTGSWNVANRGVHQNHAKYIRTI
jgi:hypothetical protein